MHLDNMPARNSKHSREALEATGATRVPHPAYSCEIVPSDFYLVDNLMEKLQSVVVTDRDSLISAISEIFSETRQDEPIAVYQKWMKRLRCIIKNGG
jgi:hypothetical protein